MTQSPENWGVPNFVNKYLKHAFNYYRYFCQVLNVLKETIRDEEMFDVNNPSIILCDEELEAALGRKTLSVTQIR